MPADLAASRLRRGLLVAAAGAGAGLLTAGSLPVLRLLYATGWIAPQHYHVAFVALCILPAATAHVAATLAKARGTTWWAVWLPGIAVYAAFPWQGPDGWHALWIFGHAWDWGRTIFLHWDGAGPFVFNSFGSFIAMLMVTMVACGRLWTGAAKAVGHAGSDALAPENAADALPSAAWAATDEIVKRFSAPGGMVLGELTDPTRHSPNFAPDRRRSWGRQGQGRLITMSPTDGNGHVLVTSQASGYKSTGLVIPNIVTYKGPLVVFDPKCELFARTRHARRKMGFEPVVIDAENGFDPARLIAALAEDHPSAYLRMAKMVIPKGHGGIENSQYFKDAATNLFCALLAHYGGTGSMSILQDIARILADPPDEAHTQLSEELSESTPAFVQNEIAALNGMDPKFWASIKTEIANQLLFCSLPDVERYITMDPRSELPSQVVDPCCDIFLNIPQNVAEDFAPMLRLMLGSMLTAAQLIEVNEAPRARRLFLIDEAAKLGAMDILENIRDRGRSLGLHLMMFYQTVGEIERLWGRAGM
ncbi:MAG: TraM recognition domain-containing protein, partial [Alphaproteobacteria bacterium]|nr:TraM recognition domain-containing protein [Alphaproteobacteria bacterium]